MAEWRRIIHRTNVTGLGGRRDYETAFGPLAREQRKALCAPIPFLVALRSEGVPIGLMGSLGAYAPDEELPQALKEELAAMNEVVEAAGTQILEMRESGGERSGDFSVQGRMEIAILMVALGDTTATRLRETAWSRDGQGNWILSAVTENAAARDGLTRDEYEFMAADLGGVLPPVESRAVARARIADEEAGCVTAGTWISYASLSTLLEDALA